MVIKKVYFLLFIALLVSCKKLDTSPEARDPVYKDLLEMSEKGLKDIAAKEKTLSANKQKISDGHVELRELKVLRDSVFSDERALAKLKQMQKYYELSAESRKIYDKKQSIKSYLSGGAWDPSTESTVYFKEKALASQSKVWSRGMASVPDPKKSSKKPGEDKK